MESDGQGFHSSLITNSNISDESQLKHGDKVQPRAWAGEALDRTQVRSALVRVFWVLRKHKNSWLTRVRGFGAESRPGPSSADPGPIYKFAEEVCK